MDSDPNFVLVLDTNIVLDVFVFNDPAAQSLKRALASKKFQWLATQPMRAELARVLAYPQIMRRLDFYQLTAVAVLAQFDGLVHGASIAPKASVTCADPDDQKFIDLAVAQQATLLSKDRAVLCMAKRLLTLGVHAHCSIDQLAPAIAIYHPPHHEDTHHAD